MIKFDRTHQGGEKILPLRLDSRLLQAVGDLDELYNSYDRLFW
jgi:hypothetical protein